MSNYEENDQQSVANFILSNLSRHKQFALSTVDEHNRPWVVCVHSAYDNEINFIWKSAKVSEHSKNISVNPNVAICVFSKTDDIGDFGYYCRAVAHEVSDREELEILLDVRYAQKGKPTPIPEDVLGDSLTRIYYAVVEEAWVNDDRHLKLPVDLAVLKEISKHSS
jgi:hypothetical protein